MSNNAKNITVADLAAKAVEDGIVTVPAQAEGETTEQVDETFASNEGPELEVVEGGKKTLKERVAFVTDQLKKHKKTLAGVGAIATVATVAFLKFSAAKAAEVIEETVQDEDQSDASDEAEQNTTDNA